MLARTAEYLFWAGRYLERTEATARLLNVTYHRLLEVTPAEEELAWTDVLVALGSKDEFDELGSAPTSAAVTSFLVMGPDNPGSVLGTVARARENARGVREHLPMEVWEALNGLHLVLGSRDLPSELAGEPFELFATVRVGVRGVMACVTETWSREDAWRFFMLGLLLERAESCARTLRVRHPRHQADAAHEWSATLRSASALQAYRRRYRVLDPTSMVELLLLSPTLPRSVLFSLAAAEEILAGVTARRPDERSVALRRLGRLRAELEFADADELASDDLGASLTAIEAQIRAVSDAVAAECFAAAAELVLNELGVAEGIPHADPVTPVGTA